MNNLGIEVTKSLAMTEKVEDDSQKLVRCCYNGLFMTLTFGSFFSIISFEHLGIKDAADGHFPNYSTEMRTSPFGNFQFSHIISGLIDYRVKSGESDEFPVMSSKSSNVLHLREENTCTEFPYARDGGQDFHLLLLKGFNIGEEFSSKSLYFLLQIKESPDLTFEEEFPLRVIYADGVIGDIKDGGRCYFDLSTSALCDGIYDILNAMDSKLVLQSLRMGR